MNARRSFEMSLTTEYSPHIHFPEDCTFGNTTVRNSNFATIIIFANKNNKFLVNKTNRCTEFQFYWCYDSICFGQPFCPSSGVFSHTWALVHFVQLWWPFATGSRMELYFHPIPGSKRSSQLHKIYQSRCTAKNSWWWAERLPEMCRVVIPIKLIFSASVDLIHKDSVSMHGHTNLRKRTKKL